MEPKQNCDEQGELHSITEVIHYQRRLHPNWNRWLFGIYMFALVSWLIIRYGILQPVITYFKGLIAEQRTVLRLNETKQNNDSQNSK